MAKSGKQVNGCNETNGPSPKVSIILTSFNHADFIREAIDSALNQTFTDFELLIWDDASSDNSWELINEYSDQRIKAFRNEQQRRGVWAYNKSIFEIAKGEYIAIHHSDDAWELDKLEKQVAYLDTHDEIGAVFTWAQIIDEHGQNCEGDWFVRDNKTRWQWLNVLFNGENHLNHPSVLIRKNCYQTVGGYRYGLGQTADAEMWSRVLIKYSIHVIQERLTKHRLFTDKSNTSGFRIDTEIRAHNEWEMLRVNYLSIENFEDIVATFPGLERYRNPDGFDIKFLLAMACLYECEKRNAWQSGIKWLFELLNNGDCAKNIENLYSFTYINFIKLTEEFDIYSLRAIAEIKTSSQNMSEIIDQQSSKLDELYKEIEENRRSLKWQVQRTELLQSSLIHKEALLDQTEIFLTKSRRETETTKNELSDVKQSVSYQLELLTKQKTYSLVRLAKIFYLIGRLMAPVWFKNSIISLLRKRKIKEYSAQGQGIVNEPYFIQPLLPVLDNRPKVVHVIANFLTGGSSRLVADIIEHLGHFCEQEILTSHNPDPVAYIGVPIHVFSSVDLTTNVLDYLEKYQPAMMHVHYWGYGDKPWYEQAILAGEKYGCKIIENVNTPVEPYWSDSIAKYVHVSDYVKNEFGKGSADELTIYPGSNFELFSREQVNQVSDDCIGMVYRLEKDKLDEESINVFIEVAKLRPQTKMLIVGHGPFVALYSDAVKKAGVASSFEFTGLVNYSRLPDLYRQMSIYVAPVVRESFGQVTPFAMSMGLPVAGYDVGALSEILGSKECLAPAQDSSRLAQIIISLLDDREKRIELGKFNQDRAHQKFSVEEMVRKYSVLYKEQLGLIQ